MPDNKRLLFKKLLRFLQYLTPQIKQKKVHIVFDACEKFHYFHIEPIVQKIIEDKRFKVTIIKWRGFNKKEMIQGVTYRSFHQFWHDWFNLYDILVSTELERKPAWFNDGIAVCMFHGAGPKISYIKTPVINEYDILFSVGPTIYNILKEYVDDFVTVEKIGLPITDALISDTPHPLPASIKINPSKPSLLYAPSWSLNTEHISMDDDILNSLTEIENYNVIIRPHPNLLIPEKCNNKNWNIKLEELKKLGIQISYSKDHSAYDLLPHVDILLGDISSVTYEFLILNRPIILYMKDGVLNAFDAEEFTSPLLSATTKLQSAESLKSTIEKINLTDNLSTDRTELLNQTLFNIGSATDAAITAITKYYYK